MPGITWPPQMYLSLECLPEVPLERVFSYLPVSDLKNVRLSSMRLNCSVIRLEKRFKVLTIRTSRGLPDEEKLMFLNSQQEINLHVDNDYHLPYKDCASEICQTCALEDGVHIFTTWLVKHAWRIVGIDLDFKNAPRLTSSILECRPKLDKLRNLKILHLDKMCTLLYLLSEYGPRLESLVIHSGACESDDTQLDSLQLRFNSLKRVELRGGVCASARRILESLPPTVEFLHLQGEDIDLAAPRHSLNKLKELRLLFTREYKSVIPPNSLSFCGMAFDSLSRLNLSNVDLQGPVNLDKPFTSLKLIALKQCTIDSRAMKNLLLKSSKTLETLLMNRVHVEGSSDFDFDLPLLSSLGMWCIEPYNFKEDNWIPQLLKVSSSSLTTLVLRYFNLNFLGEVDHDLPELRTLSISFSSFVRQRINRLLNRCSTSLQVLYLANGIDINLAVEIPNLKGLYLGEIGVHGLDKLLRSSRQRLEALVLTGVNIPFQKDLTGCELPRLRHLHLEPTTTGLLTALKACIPSDLRIQHGRGDQETGLGNWNYAKFCFDHSSDKFFADLVKYEIDA